VSEIEVTMYTEITTALSSIKIVSDLATLVLKSKVDSAVTQKAIDLQAALITLQSTVMSIQAQNQDLLAENSQLKQQLIAAKNWEAEAQKYSLTEIIPGTFVYAINQDQLSTQPYHWLCTHCYENKQKSILQRGGKEPRGWVYNCPICKAQIFGPGEPARLIAKPGSGT